MGELKSICRTVLIPDKPLSLYFLDRRSGHAAWFQMALPQMSFSEAIGLVLDQAIQDFAEL